MLCSCIDLIHCNVFGCGCCGITCTRQCNSSRHARKKPQRCSSTNIPPSIEDAEAEALRLRLPVPSGTGMLAIHRPCPRSTCLQIEQAIQNESTKGRSGCAGPFRANASPQNMFAVRCFYSLFSANFSVSTVQGPTASTALKLTRGSMNQNVVLRHRLRGAICPFELGFASGGPINQLCSLPAHLVRITTLKQGGSNTQDISGQVLAITRSTHAARRTPHCRMALVTRATRTRTHTRVNNHTKRTATEPNRTKTNRTEPSTPRSAGWEGVGNQPCFLVHHRSY